MEGLVVHWERTVLLSTPTMRTDLFRPMRRAATDLTFSSKKKEKHERTTRSSIRRPHVPVVSVQYDVPKTPTSPVFLKPRKPIHSQIQGSRTRNEDRTTPQGGCDQVRGMGVGKFFTEQQMQSAGQDDPPLQSHNNSSSTPTVPYSTADILYGSEVNGRSQLDEIRQNSFTELERGKELTRQKSKDLKELEQHPNNRRPSSKSGSRKSLSIETVAVDREKEKEKEDPLKVLSSSLPPTKATNHFRPNGIRNNVIPVKGEQVFSSRSNVAVSGRDGDDNLVAMGTLWSPNQQGQAAPRLGVQQNSIGSSPSKINASNSVNMTPQRKYTSNNSRPIVVQNNHLSGIRNNLKEKEAEPKYTDPLLGAPASFQQRLIELGALEGDTVRWERTKRMKKKKQDRDS